MEKNNCEIFQEPLNVQILIAEHCTDPKILDNLANSTNSTIRMLVVCNPSVGIETLKKNIKR